MNFTILRMGRTGDGIPYQLQEMNGILKLERTRAGMYGKGLNALILEQQSTKTSTFIAYTCPNETCVERCLTRGTIFLIWEAWNSPQII